MVMYGVCKPLASLQQLQLPFQVLTSVYHILNYGSGQNRLHLARFRLICTSILHFASPILVPFAMSPCIFPLTSLPLLFSIRFFWILHLSASSFFLDGCISISLRTVSFPGGSWSLQAWMFDYYILPVFCVCSSLAPLLTRAVPFFSVFVTARNTFHVRLWHPAMTAPSVSWRL